MVLDNPFIRVVWEDTPENFTQERLRRVKSYFRKKYNSTNVNVVTKSQSLDGEEIKLGLDTNIVDPVYQKKLLKDFMVNENSEISWQRLSKFPDLENHTEKRKSFFIFTFNKTNMECHFKN